MGERGEKNLWMNAFSFFHENGTVFGVKKKGLTINFWANEKQWKWVARSKLFRKETHRTQIGTSFQN